MLGVMVLACLAQPEFSRAGIREPHPRTPAVAKRQRWGSLLVWRGWQRGSGTLSRLTARQADCTSRGILGGGLLH